MFGYKEALEHIGGLQTKCYLTGRAINIENSEEYELDHIIPVSKGGSCIWELHVLQLIKLKKIYL